MDNELLIGAKVDNIIGVKVKINFIKLQDEYVIYDHLSGDTHLLDEISGELLCSLNTQEMSRDDLLKKLVKNFAELTWLDINNYLDVFIDRFVALDLLNVTNQRA
ncbi:MAG: HPr-rel-A system PqqD family peptide chaperone [Methylococcaceae bacterium]|jgi:PqqD family protein of HPr-rel-A system|nr:HPr-rel-A system PqqD family peptide chaperone [Methylococcaceae bacterium]MDZ4157273.1 HPr-rel-A system PqqD family peptide chaperone [Methylococcales bacterium]MDP2392563.1 HPr-rel-A system PqqD family peptide chaperone [Methylococcaceae bacterium]MDP3021063.1 HPr-rel-A system PqqD family peptide chaperone [Methylococcaceae bacterium]MDP3388450.1 HPr-rel-A system PqqD family peptide chaperone [Methylococcaceae bacterium]